jgi:hypothetical protein
VECQRKVLRRKKLEVFSRKSKQEEAFWSRQMAVWFLQSPRPTRREASLFYAYFTPPPLFTPSFDSLNEFKKDIANLFGFVGAQLNWVTMPCNGLQMYRCTLLDPKAKVAIVQLEVFLWVIFHGVNLKGKCG